jgi:hypothetical protein
MYKQRLSIYLNLSTNGILMLVKINLVKPPPNFGLMTSDLRLISEPKSQNTIKVPRSLNKVSRFSISQSIHANLAICEIGFIKYVVHENSELVLFGKVDCGAEIE